LSRNAAESPAGLSNHVVSPRSTSWPDAGRI
jgi:hypothetical protein